MTTVRPVETKAADSAPALPEDVLARFRAVVGPEHVLAGDELSGHADPYSFLENPALAAAAVQPSSVEQVQAIVLLAGECQVPLWTVSRGRNYAYGGAAPRVAGSVVLDLQRMDRVLEVDEELGYVVVEPGVSFLDLHAHLTALGSRLLLSVPDLGWGSVIGNALERGFGYAALGNHSANICGLEVVLADGTVLATGMGAKPGSPAAALYRGGYGPSLDELFLQSNLGVVTKMGIWVQPRPETIVVCHARTASDDELGPLVDALRPLLLDGTIQSPASVGNATVIASVMSDRATWYTGEGAMPPEAVAGIVSRTGLGWWNAGFALYGPEVITSARLQVVRAVLEAIPGVTFDATTYAGDVDPSKVHPADSTKLGIPGIAMVRMAAWRGGEPAHTDFSLVCPNRSADVLRQRDLIKAGVERHGFDYGGGFTMFPRHTIALALLSFDRSDPEQRQAVRELFPELIAEAGVLGYAPYRSHTAFMDLIAAQYHANDNALGRTLATLKDALDPGGTLSPGKQGVWPGRSAARQAGEARNSGG